MPLLAVERRADAVIFVNPITDFGQEAVVFVFGRVGNAACRTADIRAAARTFHRIAAVARAFGFMAATLRIQQGCIGAAVVHAEADGVCPFAVAAAVTVFHHCAELPVVQQQITPLQGLVIHTAAQCAAAGIERVRPLHNVDVAHQLRVDGQARTVEIAVACIQ